jgi:hypothetical protein
LNIFTKEILGGSGKPVEKCLIECGGILRASPIHVLVVLANLEGGSSGYSWGLRRVVLTWDF